MITNIGCLIKKACKRLNRVVKKRITKINLYQIHKYINL